MGSKKTKYLNKIGKNISHRSVCVVVVVVVVVVCVCVWGIMAMSTDACWGGHFCVEPGCVIIMKFREEPCPSMNNLVYKERYH